MYYLIINIYVKKVNRILIYFLTYIHELVFPWRKLYRLSCWVKISADDILKYYSYFSQKIRFGISCKLFLTWNVKVYSMGKIRKYHQSVICLISMESVKVLVFMIWYINVHVKHEHIWSAAEKMYLQTYAPTDPYAGVGGWGCTPTSWGKLLQNHAFFYPKLTLHP